MLKFFRKDRQNLLSQGRTGKYFRYAIGGIILVVAGILIALQINNWNENYKLNTKLDQYKVNLIAELEKDIEEIDSLNNLRIACKKSALKYV